MQKHFNSETSKKNKTKKKKIFLDDVGLICGPHWRENDPRVGCGLDQNLLEYSSIQSASWLADFVHDLNQWLIRDCNYIFFAALF